MMFAWSDRVRWGVIDAARRRQRRHRLAAVAAILLVGLFAALIRLGAGGGEPSGLVALRPASSPVLLNGARLGRTGLRLVISQNGGPVAIVNVDSGHVTSLTRLRVPINQGPSVTLGRWSGRALAVVTHQACGTCALTEDEFGISGDGVVRRLRTHHFPAFDGMIERAQLPGSLAEWVLRRPRQGSCTLQLVPSRRPSVVVPCGDLGAVSARSVEIWTDQDRTSILVDPRTGATLRQPHGSILVDPIGGGLAIEGPRQGSGTLSLVRLSTGRHWNLAWPSRLRFGYQLYPDPAGPLLAIEFADPAYPDYSNAGRPTSTIGQAADLWLLNTRTRKLTHVPGFPIFEALKASGVGWTADGRLVIAADGGSFSQPAKRVAIGVWRPGQRTIRVGALPPVRGYDQIVPITR